MGAVPLLALTLALGLAGPAAAHSPHTAPPDAVSWNLAPWLVSLLLISACLYALGLGKLWRRAGAGHGVLRWQAAAFAIGWLGLVAALVSPLDSLGTRLFSAHMVQHEVLMLVAAPLLVLGRPLAAWTWAFPPGVRRSLGHATRWPWLALAWSALTAPVSAWSLHALALWAWHVPVLFEAALHSESLHIFQHASFLGTALLFWWAVLGGDSPRRGFAMAYLFTTMMHTGALGALLTFAPTPWYPSYTATSAAFGLDAVEDQQLGGLVRWVPGGLAYLFAGLVMMARLLARPAPSARAQG
jgi:putative membrane protein